MKVTSEVRLQSDVLRLKKTCLYIISFLLIFDGVWNIFQNRLLAIDEDFWDRQMHLILVQADDDREKAIRIFVRN